MGISSAPEMVGSKFTHSRDEWDSYGRSNSGPMGCIRHQSPTLGREGNSKVRMEERSGLTASWRSRYHGLQYCRPQPIILYPWVWRSTNNAPASGYVLQRSSFWAVEGPE